MSVHEDLIAELLSGKVALSPRENAAVNEIQSLRAAIIELEAKVRMLSQHPAEPKTRARSEGTAGGGGKP